MLGFFRVYRVLIINQVFLQHHVADMQADSQAVNHERTGWVTIE